MSNYCQNLNEIFWSGFLPYDFGAGAWYGAGAEYELCEAL